MNDVFAVRLFSWIVTFAIFFCFSSAYAGERVALVIANQGYGNTIGRLTQSLAGGRQVAAALRDSRFEVTEASDVDLTRLAKSLDEFAGKVGREAAAARAAGKRLTSFIYFTGHGLADDRGANYLVPIRSSALVPEQLADTAVALQSVVDRLTAAAADANHIIVVDACRTQLDERGVLIAPAAGFALRSLTDLPPGVQVTFSTSPALPAADTAVFATALSKWIVRANVDHQVAFAKMMQEVFTRTGETQQPTSVGNLHEPLRLGFAVDAGDADDRQHYEVVKETSLVFKHDGALTYSRADDAAGVVEVVGRGTVRRSLGAAPEIFRVLVDGSSEWFSYRTLWGRAYVRSSIVALQ